MACFCVPLQHPRDGGTICPDTAVRRITHPLPKDQRIFLTSVVSYDRFMKSHLLRSTGAILAGFLFVVVTSILTDFILSKTGIMKEPFHANPSWFIGLVILYRCLYGVMGSYLTAKLAPGKPMQHAMTGGLIGLAISLLGAITMWDIPPHWYPVALVITVLPTAWLGGYLFIRKSRTR